MKTPEGSLVSRQPTGAATATATVATSFNIDIDSKQEQEANSHQPKVVLPPLPSSGGNGLPVNASIATNNNNFTINKDNVDHNVYFSQPESYNNTLNRNNSLGLEDDKIIVDL